MRALTWWSTDGGRLGYPDCVACMDEMQTPGLVEACASVGIEHGKSTGLMMREFIEAFHARGHTKSMKEDAA